MPLCEVISTAKEIIVREICDHFPGKAQILGGGDASSVTGDRLGQGTGRLESFLQDGS